MTIMLIHHQLLSQNDNNITIPSIQNSINQSRPVSEKMQRTNSYYKKYANKNINPLQSTKNKNKYSSNLSNEYKAMRYYKIWIYTCNIALFISIVGFVVISFKIIINNYKRKLIVDFHLLQPSLLYIYIALFIQCSFLQIIGYFGAKKLNIKLLNFYWLLILLLLINDIIFGIIFLYNYNILITNLNFKLKSQLRLYASKNTGGVSGEATGGEEFVELWQKLQVEYKCCGVDNFVDFYNVNVSNMAAFPEPTLPFSTMPTYPPEIIEEFPTTTLQYPPVDILDDPEAPIEEDARIHNQDKIFLPNSCCKKSSPTPPTNTAGSPSPPVSSRQLLLHNSSVKSFFSKKLLKSDSLLHFAHQKKKLYTSTQTPPYLLPPVQAESKITLVDNIQCLNQERLIYSSGCLTHLVYWIQSTRDIMFVLLYCVISFLKLCFLGILRYEIKEMIQKIKILQGELKIAANLPELLETSKSSSKKYIELNGNIVTGLQESQDSSSNRRHLVPSESGNLVTSPLLTLSETESPDTNESRHTEHRPEPRPSCTPKLPPSQRHSLKLSQLHAIDMGGGDSDSNSHCALLEFPSHTEASNVIGFIRASSGGSGNGRSFSSGNARASRSLNSRSSSYELSDLRKTHM